MGKPRRSLGVAGTGRSSIPGTARLEPRSCGVLDRPLSRATTASVTLAFKHAFTFSRLDARGLTERRPSSMRGSRECRVRAAPAVSCAICTKKSAHEHTGSAEAVRHSLRNGFTAYTVLSPATNSSCHRRCRLDGWSIRSDRIRRRQLGTSNGCRDHTVLPYAAARLRPTAVIRNRTSASRLRRARRRSSCAPRTAHGSMIRPAISLRANAAASTASQPAFVTTRDPPLLPGWDGASW
jgi:hypothetical protein